MNLEKMVAATLASHRPALISLTQYRFDWPRADIALLGRGVPEATARLQALARMLIAPRSAPIFEPIIIGNHTEQTATRLQARFAPMVISAIHNRLAVSWRIGSISASRASTLTSPAAISPCARTFGSATY